MNNTETPAGQAVRSNPLLGIGSIIWRFDENHRIYKEPRGGPDYRSFWRECAITGETSRSWIIGNCGKCPKRGEHVGWALSAHEVDDDVWAKDERHRIVRCVERCNVATLRAVAALVGYMPNAPLERSERSGVG
jgi:hypothetical protein